MQLRSVKTVMKGIDPKLMQLRAATQFAGKLVWKMKMSYTKRLVFCGSFVLH